MSRYKFIATVMVPEVREVKAQSLEHARTLIRKEYKIDPNIPCNAGSTQPFLHSMRVVAGEQESDVA